jgi:hypothetical protein
MKTQEEIEQLAKEYAKSLSIKINKTEFTEYAILDFSNGYTQSQEDMADKKYTKEDMLKSFWAGVDCEADNGKNFEQFINSLNKD